jgi:4-amino-4-deoxy-L-arabinose transferase-like glycosyltransferase
MHGYLRQAIRLVSGQGYEGTYIPPGYPVALAAAMRFLGTGMDAACVVNALLGSLTVISVFLASRILLSPSLAIVAAAVVAFDPPEIIYASMMLSESLALALVAAAIAALAWRSTRNGSILGGLLLGLGALTRESLVVFLLLVSIALWRRRGWRLALAFLVAGILPIVPWTIRNTVTTGHPILVSSRTGYNLLIGNNPFADGSQTGGKRIFQVVDPPVPESLPAAERHERGADYALGWIKGHPKEFVAKGLVGVLRMFGLDRQFLYSLREGYYGHTPGGAEKLLVVLASAGSWLIVLPLAILGVMAGEPWLRALGLCAFQWVCILGFAVFGEWRFRVPVLPIFVLLAVAAGRAWVRGEIQRRSWVVLGVVMAPVLAYWVWEVLERAEEAGRILG